MNGPVNPDRHSRIEEGCQMATKVRIKKAVKRFILENGSESASAHPQAKILEFRFDEGGTHQVRREDFPADIRICNEWNGIGQKLTDTYAGTDSAEDAEEAFESLLAQLVAGQWVATREGIGPNPVMVLAAIRAAKEEAGLPFDEEASKTKYASKEARETALKVPTVRKHYEHARAARAAEKAAAATKAAEAEAGDVSTL